MTIDELIAALQEHRKQSGNVEAHLMINTICHPIETTGRIQNDGPVVRVECVFIEAVQHPGFWGENDELCSVAGCGNEKYSVSPNGLIKWCQFHHDDFWEGAK